MHSYSAGLLTGIYCFQTTETRARLITFLSAFKKIKLRPPNGFLRILPLDVFAKVFQINFFEVGPERIDKIVMLFLRQEHTWS